ncbi:MAG: alpha/beta fold hydrolase [Pseudomonadota bacterium]
MLIRAGRVIALVLALSGTTAMALQDKQAGQSEVSIDGPEAPIIGSLTTSSAEDAPLVIIIPGSGPTDRDGNNPLGVRAQSYKLLAEALAERGIDTIRYDKRGMFASKGAIADANAVTIADYAADALAFAEQDMASSGRPCAWLLGHSEGGLIALAAARSASICGLVLVATPGRTIGALLRDQLRANPANAPILDQAMQAIDTLEAGQTFDDSSLHPGLLPLFNRSVQPFLIDMMRYNPQALIADTDKPVLLLYGTSDIQVTQEEGELLKTANDRAKLIILPDVNHVLKAVPDGDRAANLMSYQNPDMPLAPGVADSIAGFITAKTKAD